ncbi:hypothetical protein [Parablautia intestinalis]
MQRQIYCTVYGREYYFFGGTSFFVSQILWWKAFIIMAVKGE